MHKHELKRYYEFAEAGEWGPVSTLYCKNCGDKIAEWNTRPRAAAGPGANQFVDRYRRLPNYREAKFRLSSTQTRLTPVVTGKGRKAKLTMVSEVYREPNGGFHVTHGCKNCIRRDMDLELAQHFYEADMLQMGQGPMQDQKVEEVVEIDDTGSGIV
jgi:hypothetical protein